MTLPRGIPENLHSLHQQEEEIRQQRIQTIPVQSEEASHLALIECVMDVADMIRKYPTNDEDLFHVQIMCLRVFNAYGAALKLSLSGYYQVAASIARDLLETGFLMELFAIDSAELRRWREVGEDGQHKHFSPSAVRKLLEARQNEKNPNRETRYKLLSRLAAHPSLHSHWMLRDKPGALAKSGPFHSDGLFRASLEELAYIGIVLGQAMLAFVPPDWLPIQRTRASFRAISTHWSANFVTPLKPGQSAPFAT